MTKLTPIPTGAVLIAIDMSNNRQEALIKRPEGGQCRRMTIMATKEDYDGFAEQLVAIGPPSSGSRRPATNVGACSTASSPLKIKPQMRPTFR